MQYTRMCCQYSWLSNGRHGKHAYQKRAQINGIKLLVINKTISCQVNGVVASYDGVALLNNTNVKLNLTFAEVAVAGGALAIVENVKADNTAVIPMNELVTLHQDHTITADVAFDKVLVDNLQVSGTGKKIVVLSVI